MKNGIQKFGKFLSAMVRPDSAAAPSEKKASGKIHKIAFACDAGMGTSAMGASKFRNRIKEVRPDITVIHSSVDHIPADCDIVVVQTVLADRARKSAPQTQLVEISNFLSDPALDQLFERITAKAEKEAASTEVETAKQNAGSGILKREGIKLGQKAVSKEEAITAAGKLLVSLGYVDEAYIPAMLAREKLATTYMGKGIAIPHGISQAKDCVKKSGIVVLQYPEGVPFGDEKAKLVFGIAGVGNEHLEILSNICGALENEDILNNLLITDDAEVVLKHLQ